MESYNITVRLEVGKLNQYSKTMIAKVIHDTAGAYTERKLREKMKKSVKRCTKEWLKEFDRTLNSLENDSNKQD